MRGAGTLHVRGVVVCSARRVGVVWSACQESVGLASGGGRENAERELTARLISGFDGGVWSAESYASSRFHFWKSENELPTDQPLLPSARTQKACVVCFRSLAAAPRANNTPCLALIE